MTYTPARPVESRTYRHFSISTLGHESTSLAFASATNVVSTAWPLANLAIYMPIYINETVILYEVGFGTGLTSGGNWDVGIYDTAGTRLQSTGTTVRTASAWNVSNWTDLTLQPGWYYAAMSADGTNNYSGVAPAAGLCEAMGICEQTTAFVLPATATLARTTRAFIPQVSFACRSVAL